MRDEYDFSNAVRNPFAGRTKGKYTVIIHYDFTEGGDEESDGTKISGGKDAANKGKPPSAQASVQISP